MREPTYKITVTIERSDLPGVKLKTTAEVPAASARGEGHVFLPWVQQFDATAPQVERSCGYQKGSSTAGPHE